MTDLSIIIVSYNTRDFLKKCLNSIYDSNIQNFEVIVVDNASFDGSPEMIRKEFPKTILVENKDNFGFSKANNIGIKKTTGKYILFLNSDTLVEPQTLKYMVEFMDVNKDAGAASCKVSLMDGKLDDASHRGFPTPWNSFCHFSGLSKLGLFNRLFGGYNLNWMNLNVTHKIDACAGAFMIVRKEAGDKINWWDEDYFWYGEDLDFCYRLKKKGWNVYFVPEVSILHYKGVSGGIKKASKELTTANLETKKLATIARFEAMRIFYRKHYRNQYPGFINWIVLNGISLKEKFTSV